LCDFSHHLRKQRKKPEKRREEFKTTNRESKLSEEKAEILEPTINFTDDEGTQLVKELDKEFLSKGAWSTIMFKYCDLNKQTGEFGPPKVAIRRYQKVNGEYKYRSKFNISSEKQALKVIEILSGWFGEKAD